MPERAEAKLDACQVCGIAKRGRRYKNLQSIQASHRPQRESIGKRFVPHHGEA